MHLLLQPSRGAGRAESGEGTAPAPPDTTAEQSADGAAPTAPPPGGGGGLFGSGTMMMLLPLLLLVGFMMLMSRSDKKRRAELENKLKRGDRVVTRAGFIGKIAEMGDNHAKIEIAPGVVVKMVKSAIEGLAEEEGAKAPAKDGKDAKDAPKEAKDEPSDKDAKKKK